MKNNFKCIILLMCSIVAPAIRSSQPQLPPPPPQWLAGVPRRTTNIPHVPPTPPSRPQPLMSPPPMPPPPPPFVQQIMQVQTQYNILKNALAAKNTAQAQPALTALEKLVQSLSTQVRQFATEKILPVDEYTATLGKPTQAGFFDNARKYIATFSQPVAAPITRPVPPPMPPMPLPPVPPSRPMPPAMPQAPKPAVLQPSYPRAEEEEKKRHAQAAMTEYETSIEEINEQMARRTTMVANQTDLERKQSFDDMWKKLQEQLSLLKKAVDDPCVTLEKADFLWGLVNNTFAMYRNQLFKYNKQEPPAIIKGTIESLKDAITQRFAADILKTDASRALERLKEIKKTISGWTTRSFYSQFEEESIMGPQINALKDIAKPMLAYIQNPDIDKQKKKEMFTLLVDTFGFAEKWLTSLGRSLYDQLKKIKPTDS